VQIRLFTAHGARLHELAAGIEDCLKAAAAKGVARYGVHRQDAAMMTCFTPSPVNPNHVHFIDVRRAATHWPRPRSRKAMRASDACEG
jgi:hypothetical protein